MSVMNVLLVERIEGDERVGKGGGGAHLASGPEIAGQPLGRLLLAFWPSQGQQESAVDFRVYVV